MGNAAAPAGAVGPSRDYWPARAADAAADSAEAAVPSEGLRAGRSSGRAEPEYTAARGRHDHATMRERAYASVRCAGRGVKRYMSSSDKARAGYDAQLQRFFFLFQVTE